MKRCYECGSSQIEGTLFCVECGLSLLSPQHKNATDVLPFTHLRHHTTPRLPTEHDPVTSEDELSLTIIVPSSRKHVQLPLQSQIQVGRTDGEDNFYPELDLTDYNGGQKGASRHHAVFEASAKQGVVLIDLDSTNGTHLNGYRLVGKRPYLIKDGDEIRFGDLLVHIFINS